VRDPTRLRDRAELPDALREALRSLEQQAPAENTVTRIQQQLEGLARNPALLPHAGAKLVPKVATLAIGTAIGLSAVWMLQYQRTEPSARAPVAAAVTKERMRAPSDEASEPSTAPAQAPPAQPVLAKQRTADPAEVVTRLPAAVGPRRVRSPQASSTRPATSNDSQAVTGRAAATPSEPGEPAAGSVAPILSEESQPRGLAPQRDLVTRQDVEPASEARAAPRPVEPERVDSEASVLYRAKGLEVRDPTAALRLLDGHARDFPNGAFVEERYALSIRILERLGRTQAAAELRRAFQSRFPSSVYQTTLAP
jgi:hypothetical protein